MKTGRQAGPPPNRTGSQGGDSPQPGQRLLGRALEPKPERQLTGATRVRPGQTPTSAKVGPNKNRSSGRQAGPPPNRGSFPHGDRSHNRGSAEPEQFTGGSLSEKPNRLPKATAPGRRLRTGPAPKVEAPNRTGSPRGNRSRNERASSGSEPGQLPRWRLRAGQPLKTAPRRNAQEAWGQGFRSGKEPRCFFPDGRRQQHSERHHEDHDSKSVQGLWWTGHLFRIFSGH